MLLIPLRQSNLYDSQGTDCGIIRSAMDAEGAREFLRKYQDMIEELFLKRECYRRLILDSGAIPENELEQIIQDAKRDPENQRIAANAFAGSRQALAEFGLQDALRVLIAKPPTADKQN